MFTPLSNIAPDGDVGDYICSADVRDSEYITGNSSNGTQLISVEGQCFLHDVYNITIPYLLYHRPGLTTSDSGG